MDHTAKFTGKSEAYVSARPGYPKDFFQYLTKEAGVNQNSVIADIGSGTGKLSKDLLKIAGRVYCVEPNTQMRKTAETLLKHHPAFVSVCGTAEQTSLADHSVDFITCAQAFHWFDVQAFQSECFRILKNNGTVFLIWNSRVRQSPLVQENAQICRRFCPEFKGFSGGIDDLTKNISTFFSGHYEKQSIRNDLAFDLPKFIQRMLSASYSLTQGDLNFEKYLSELEQLFFRHAVNGILTMPNETVWYTGKIRLK